LQVTSLPDFWLKLTNFYICGYANVELILSFPVSFTSLINCWTKSEYYYIRFQEIFAVLVSVVSTRNKWSWYVSQTNGLGTSLKQMVLVRLSKQMILVRLSKQMILVRLSNKWSWYISQTNGLGTSLKQMVLVRLSNKWSWYVSQTTLENPFWWISYFPSLIHKSCLQFFWQP
jgi:hypothetical protein